METRSRLMFGRFGLPEPELNADVFDANGQWILCADFLWRRPRVIAEYHGDVHRTDRTTWQAGFVRRRLAEDNGWRMIEFTARDVFANSPRLELLTLLAELLLGPGAGGCALDVATRLA